MWFIGGRGGPLAVIFGLFVLFVLAGLWALKWATVGVIILLILAFRGVRALWRGHAERKERRSLAERMREAGSGTLPMPPVSRVQ